MENNQQNIFTKHKFWSFDTAEAQAQQIIDRIIKNTISKLPSQYYSPKILQHLDFIKSSSLYTILHKMPKGVMHHNHLECNDDAQFHLSYLLSDPRIYVKEEKQLLIGSKQEAEKQGWTSLKTYEEKFETNEHFIAQLVNRFKFTKQDHQKYSGEQGIWDIFEVKIANFFPFIWDQNIFKKYLIHVFTKYAKNGYELIELRPLIAQLKRYDENGNIVQKLPFSKYIQIFDEAVLEVQNQFPDFEVNVIYNWLKIFSDETNLQYLKNVFNLNWKRGVGLDFVCEQDKYHNISYYDQLVSAILKEFPHINLTKVYHAGESLLPKNTNIEQALKCGTKRIGHGLNLIHHLHLLQKAKQICIEINPVSNLLLGYNYDPRLGVAPLYLELGIPITINPDDPGKFGYQDSTVDFFVVLTSYNWTIRHLKLTFLYSIDHSLCSQQVKTRMRSNFNRKWRQWIYWINKQYI